jgi:tubulin-specific chaperone E
MDVGCRVLSTKDGATGTIRYIGDIEGEATGAWAGVEWDDPSRGKHDGSLRGRSYFCCAPGHTGSFARPETLAPLLFLAEALRRKYAASAEQNAEALRGMSVLTAGQRAVAVELVGPEKHRQPLSVIRVVDVSSCRVERVRPLRLPIVS